MSSVNKKIKAILLSALCVTFEAYSSVQLSSQCEVLVGVLLPLSGAAAAYGEAAEKGYRLAFDDISQLSPCHLKFLIEDTESTSQKAAMAVNHLIKTRHVHALLGPMTSDESNTILPILEKSGVPMVSPSATADLLASHPYFSRVCYGDQAQSRLAAWFIKNELKIDQVLILTNQDEPYSRGISLRFREFFERYGGQVIRQDFYIGSDFDFKAMVGRIRRLKRLYPSFAIFLPDHYIHSAPILRQIYEMKIQLPVVGTDGWQVGPIFFELATPEATHNHFFTSHFDPVLLDKKEFSRHVSQRFTERYHIPMDVYAVLAYESVLFLLSQIEKVYHQQDFKKELRLKLRNSEPFQGLSGTIKTVDGDPLKGGVIMTMKDSQYVFFQEVSYEDLIAYAQ